MNKNIVGIWFIILLSYSCNLNKNNNQQNFDGLNLLSDTLKYSINKIAKEEFSNTAIFSVRVTKLYKSTIVGIEPVYSNGYLNEFGSPLSDYLYNGSLFLLYSGIEDVIDLSRSYNEEVRHRFDSLCLQHGIDKKENVVNDTPPIFLKVEGSSLVPYSKGYEKDFYKTYIEVEEMDPIYTPDKDSSKKL